MPSLKNRSPIFLCNIKIFATDLDDFKASFRVAHPGTFPHFFLATLLALWFCTIAHAAEPAPSYPTLLLDDIQYVVTEPSRWQAREWNNFGYTGLAVIGTALVIDAPLRDAMRRQPRDNNFMLNIERFGAEYSLAVVGGFYLAGSLADNDKAISVAQDGLTASIIASGLITPAIKIATGRSRPYEDAGTNDFHGLGARNRNSSFPSGHTTEAFALASVISAHYEETWIRYSVYAMASLVGVARAYHDAHFASDVLAGALIGNWVGLTVVAHNQKQRCNTVAILPEISHDLTGLRLTGGF